MLTLAESHFPENQLGRFAPFLRLYTLTAAITGCDTRSFVPSQEDTAKRA